MTRLLCIAFFILLLISSCSLYESDSPDPYAGNMFLKGKGAYIINEGNYLAGNGSLSFFSADSAKIYNDIFSNANSRPLGDIPYSVSMNGDMLYIIVNNSGKIEVADMHDMRSVATIKDLNSPRNMLVINDDKAYITSLFSNEITIIGLRTNTIAGKINIRRSSEAVLMSGTRAFVSSWSAGSEIMVINTQTDKLIDSIEVGIEPESMVIDKNGKLWVLCTGGYSGNYYPELVLLNTNTYVIEKRFTFPSKTFYPSSLVINSTRDTIYYAGGAIWKMGIGETALPAKPFVKQDGRLFYKIGAEPGTSRIFATNAVDYRQKGYLLRFKSNGTVLDSVRTGIIPGSVFFKSY